MEEEYTVVLTMEDDTELECEIICIFSVEDKDYIALQPMDDEDSDVLLYRYLEDEDDNPELENIEDDEEYERVADAFDEWLDELEFDEMEDEEED